MRSVSVCCPSTGGSGTRTLANEASPGAGAASRSSCVPQSSEQRELGLEPGADGLLLCARAPVSATEASARSCWHVGIAGLGAKRSAPSSHLGHAVATEEEGGGRWHVTSTNGERKALIEADGPRFLFSRVGGPGGEVEVRLQYGGNDQGPSAAIVEAYFVDDVLFLVDHDAGPHADIIGLIDNGDLLGQIVDEVYNGSISILDEHRIAFAGPAMTSVTIYDTRTRAARTHGRSWPRPETCDDELLDMFFLEGASACHPDQATEEQATGPCCRYLQRDMAPYIGATMGALDDGRILVALTGTRAGELVVFDPETEKTGTPYSVLCP